MNPPSESQILADVTALLGSALGLDLAGAGPIDPETRFFADLGLASIDAVVLGEALQAHYGRPLPFGDLMAEVGAKADRDIAIGEFVRFLGLHLADGR